jgi:hypothetical protein
MAQVIIKVLQSVRNEVKDIVAGNSRDQDVTAKDLEDIKAAQKLIDLPAEAAKLAMEGFQMQFLAFGKIKSRVVYAIRLLKSHHTLKAIKFLEDVEQIAELRLDVVCCPGSSPGRWPLATIYKNKRLAETSDAKNDKLWDATCLEAAADRNKGRGAAGQKHQADNAFGPSQQQYHYHPKEQSRPFRGVSSLEESKIDTCSVTHEQILFLLLCSRDSRN